MSEQHQTGWKSDRVLVVEALDDVADAEGVRSRILRFGGSGWICFASKAIRWSSGDPLPNDLGFILTAELAFGEERSLHVRQDGAGWRVWELRDEVREGMEYRDESYLSTERNAEDRPARLRYRVFWKPVESMEGVHVLRPHAARFLGWEVE